MSAIAMTLTGDDRAGWTWAVLVDGMEVFRTQPLARDDLAEGLFSVQRDRSRRTARLSGLSDDELFEMLDGFFVGPLYDALRESAETETWAKHRVSPPLPAVVGSRMYLVATGSGEERLLVLLGGQRRTFRFSEGCFDERLREVRDRLEKPTLDE